VEAFSPDARCELRTGGRYNAARVFTEIDSAIDALRYIVLSSRTREARTT